MDPICRIKDTIDKHGLGEAIVDFYGHSLSKSFAGEPLPDELCQAWAKAFEAMRAVQEMVEDLAEDA